MLVSERREALRFALRRTRKSRGDRGRGDGPTEQFGSAPPPRAFRSLRLLLFVLLHQREKEKERKKESFCSANQTRARGNFASDPLRERD